MGTLSSDQVHPYYKIDAGNPTTNDDSTQGFFKGALWLRTTFPPISYVLLDDTPGAARWRREDTPKCNVSTADPTASDDENAGYEAGSWWINTVNETSFRCITPAAALAKWKQDTNEVGGSIAIPDKNLMYGTLLDYPNASGQAVGAVQYVQIKLPVDLIITDFRTFVDSGGTGSRSLRMGLYGQSDPDDPGADPVTRLAQTASTTTTGVNGTFVELPPTTGDYTIPASGYYWLALVADSGALKFAVSISHRADFLPVRKEASTGTTLPATTGVLTNPVDSLSFMSAIEE
jgi:hypothetical protein